MVTKNFWNWYHRQVKQDGDPNLEQYEAEQLHDEWDSEGKPNAEEKKLSKIITKTIALNVIFSYSPNDIASVHINPTDVTQETSFALLSAARFTLMLMSPFFLFLF